MSLDLQQEIWKPVPGFTNYEISSFGRVYNIYRDHFMSISKTQDGHVKISLISDNGSRHTLSVATMVAEAFVERPNVLCDNVVRLDGNFANVSAQNLVWRPRWFVWKYTHQLKEPQPLHYQNLGVINIITRTKYVNIIEAGIAEGLLFDHVWRSTYSGLAIFPGNAIFEINQRV